MNNEAYKQLFSYYENTFDIVFLLESIIKVTQETCIDKEIYSVHYNLSSKDKMSLSQERNNYINMLSLALDKLSNLKEINLYIEKELNCLQSNTPTIAADK